MATTKFSTIIGSAQVVFNGGPRTLYAVSVGGLGAGSFSAPKANYRIMGDCIDVDIFGVKDAVAGTGAAQFTMSLPNGWTSNSTFVTDSASVGATVVGYLYTYNINTAVQYIVGVALIQGTDNNKIFFLKIGTNTVITGADVRASSEWGVKITSLPITQLAGLTTLAQGAGLKTSLKPGLEAPGSPQINIASQVSSGQAGFSVIRAVATAYSDTNGVWNAKGHIEASFTSVVTTSNLSVGIALAGTIFRTGTSQAVASAWGGSNAVTNGLANAGTGNMSIYSNATSGAANATNVRITFDVELDSKPSWA